MKTQPNIVKISKSVADEWISKKHYRRTLGIFWEGFALIENDQIQGIVCYGQPSPSIQKYAFRDKDFRLYELTRLVVQTKTPNGASMLIGGSLKLLSKKPAAIISYADSSMGHCGIVYQATNWIYTGTPAASGPMYVVNGEKLHRLTIQDRFECKSIVKWAKENNIEEVPPTIKHRYFTFVGNKKERKSMRARLKYEEVSPYPKCDPARYDAGPQLETDYHHQGELF